MTLATRAVLAELLRDPTTEKYSLEICEAVLLASGTVHPILTRLETAGWLTSRYEDIDPRKAERPARRYFRLTTDGADLARAALARPPRKPRQRT